MLRISTTEEKTVPYMIPFTCNGTNIVSGLVMDCDAVQAVYYHQAQAVSIYMMQQ